jgi:hypothetical protein
MEIRAVEDRESAWKTPGQSASMAQSAVTSLHGFRAGSPVVTDSGCCPSAAHPPATPLSNVVQAREVVSE